MSKNPAGIKAAAGGRFRSAGASGRRCADQRPPNGRPIGKSAIPQVGKPAVRSPRPPPPEAHGPQADLTLPPFRENARY